mmetsp:Transcript_3702/g.14077  ORF Transcript_3702/g.14077 Transcript_3702/m.14077 type:complete len:333 (+) Transcript_3702:1534-2532(+)
MSSSTVETSISNGSGAGTTSNHQTCQQYPKHSIALTASQQQIYSTLRAKYPTLTHLQRLMIIFSKKSMQKSLKCASKLELLVKKYELDHIDEHHVEELLRKKMMFALPSHLVHTKDGYGVLTFLGGSFEPGTSSEKTIIQTTYYLIETLMRQNETNLREGIVFLGDLHNLGWKNFDLRLEGLLQKIFGFLPIRFKKAWLLNSPWYIKMMMAMIKPFMTQKMSERHEVCSSHATLLNYFEKKYLPKEYGGNAELDMDAMTEEYVRGLTEWNDRARRERHDNMTEGQDPDNEEHIDEGQDPDNVETIDSCAAGDAVTNTESEHQVEDDTSEDMD